jgi:hypothetical protein
VLTLTLCLFTILAFKLHLPTLVYALFTNASCTLYCVINFTLMHAPFTDASNAYASYALFRVYATLTHELCQRFHTLLHDLHDRFGCVIACLLTHSQNATTTPSDSEVQNFFVKFRFFVLCFGFWFCVWFSFCVSVFRFVFGFRFVFLFFVLCLRFVFAF